MKAVTLAQKTKNGDLGLAGVYVESRSLTAISHCSSLSFTCWKHLPLTSQKEIEEIDGGSSPDGTPYHCPVHSLKIEGIWHPGAHGHMAHPGHATHATH